VTVRGVILRTISVVGAVIGYGCLIAFLSLVGLQSYRWFHDGEWTHIGMNDGLRIGLAHCCVKDDDTGRLAAFMHWLVAPVNWLGMRGEHRRELPVHLLQRSPGQPLLNAAGVRSIRG
jgi:hypothetical protein